MKSKETKAHVMSNNGDDTTGENVPHFSKVDKVYVTNSGGIGGGGGEAGSVDWAKVTNKPQTYPPSEHNHDDRYNTKEEVQGHIDFVTEQMKQEQGKVRTFSDDSPDFLKNKVDAVTVGVRGSEVFVKSIDGLNIGVADMNAALEGTEGNIQTQIDDINDLLASVTAGMRFIGKFESFAELNGIVNKSNGDLAVVLTDETRDDTRSMYVYSEDRGMWEFIGAFTFKDEFTALKDTPTSYVDADGKVVKVAGERLVFSDVDYGDLANKPSSTITQIDDAVTKKHEHSNKESLDKITVNNDGDLVVDGKVIELKPPELPEKEFVYANARSEAYSSGTLWKWHHRTGNISFDTNGGILLKAGKSYKIDINVSFGSNFDSWKVFGFVDAETGELAPEAPTANMALMKESSTYTEAHSRTLSLIMTPQTTRRFGVTITAGASPTTNATMYSRTSITIVEI